MKHLTTRCKLSTIIEAINDVTRSLYNYAMFRHDTAYNRIYRYSQQQDAFIYEQSINHFDKEDLKDFKEDLISIYQMYYEIKAA